MTSNLIIRKLIAFLLLMVMLTVAVNRFNLKVEFFEELQDKVSHKVCLSSDDNDMSHWLKDLKKPISSVFDPVSSCGDRHSLPPYAPQLSSLVINGPFKAVPEVYLEIFVPPDEPC